MRPIVSNHGLHTGRMPATVPWGYGEGDSVSSPSLLVLCFRDFWDVSCTDDPRIPAAKTSEIKNPGKPKERLRRLLSRCMWSAQQGTWAVTHPPLHEVSSTRQQKLHRQTTQGEADVYSGVHIHRNKRKSLNQAAKRVHESGTMPKDALSRIATLS